MPKCPACESPLEQDFGMVTCANCQAVLMIDFSGQVQMADESNQVEEASGEFEISREESVIEEISVGAEGFEDQVVAADDFLATESEELEDLDENTFENYEQQVEGADWGAEEEAQLVETEADDLIESNFDQQEFESQPLDPIEEELAGSEEDSYDESLLETSEEPEEVLSTLPTHPDREPVDVTNFANSEASNLDNGEYFYTISIKGLDSKDLKETLQAVLMDNKLQLDHKHYLKEVKNGELEIQDLNPIKAKRIVEQLQFYDLDIQWHQVRVIMEPDTSPEESDERQEGEL